MNLHRVLLAFLVGAVLIGGPATNVPAWAQDETPETTAEETPAEETEEEAAAEEGEEALQKMQHPLKKKLLTSRRKKSPTA